MSICVNAVTLNDHRKSIAFQISSTAIRQCLKMREIFFLVGVVQLQPYEIERGKRKRKRNGNGNLPGGGGNDMVWRLLYTLITSLQCS